MSPEHEHPFLSGLRGEGYFFADTFLAAAASQGGHSHSVHLKLGNAYSAFNKSKYRKFLSY